MAGILISTGIAKLGEGVQSNLIPVWLYQLIACVEVLAGALAIVGYWRWPAMFSLLLACGGAVLALLGVEDCGCAGPWLRRGPSHMMLAGLLGLAAVVALRPASRFSSRVTN
jgi:hypothetical protein